jgi:hypothetical protein
LNEPVRASLDIDASFANVAANMVFGPDELELVRSLTHAAVTDYFDAQTPVRFVLRHSSVRNRRSSGPHPWGWNVYWLDLTIEDLAATSLSATTPAVRIDIAAPELVSDHSIQRIEVNGRLVKAVTLERMAGEKLRAFLSSLPKYRKKLELKIHPPRAKDLYDLSRICRKRPLDETDFWRVVGTEFRLACQSRCIDCHGIQTFTEQWEETAEVYAKDPTIPDDVPFCEAEGNLRQIVGFLSRDGLFPLTFSLPQTP